MHIIQLRMKMQSCKHFILKLHGVPFENSWNLRIFTSFIYMKGLLIIYFHIFTPNSRLLSSPTNTMSIITWIIVTIIMVFYYYRRILFTNGVNTKNIMVSLKTLQVLNFMNAMVTHMVVVIIVKELMISS